MLGKFVCCSTSLASGIALGREGPSVHMGAGLASVLGARLGLRTERIKALMPVGCAAALAAAFNTPIAAVLFSLEEVMGDLHAPIIGSVVLGSATAWMVLHLLLGDAPLFHVAAYRLVHPGELLAYAVLGVVGGFGSAAFVKLLLWLRRGFQRLPASTVWLQPVVGGLTVGILGFFVPPVLGVGYDYIERVLNGEIVLGLIVALAILKCVSTAVCYASGNAGGIFGPSLFIGAMMGAAVGAVTHAAFPAMTAAPGAYALVGMGTAFAGIVRTPLTSVIMIFELTRDYSIIVPLMISNLLAFYVSQRLQRVPIYEALALQDGIHLPRHEARGYLSAARVEQVMRPAPTLESGAEQVPVVAPDAHLHPDHSLSVALERLGASGHQQLPVVSRADVRQVLGVVTLDAVLAGFRLRAEDPPAGSGTTPVRRADRHVFVATLATVVAAMAVLAAVDVWLAAKERVETSHEAARLFAEGQRLERAGRAEPAADWFRAALAMSRDDRAYQLALARALQTGGRSAEAQDLLADLLRRQPTDGEASLLMARVLAGRGDSAGAEDYYHRAVYGHWPEHAAERQLRARVELVDLLAVSGAREALVAELMPLKTLAASHPDVLADVAEAELALRDYPAAARDFEMAVAAAPQDERLAARLALARRLSAMDSGGAVAQGVGPIRTHRRAAESRSGGRSRVSGGHRRRRRHPSGVGAAWRRRSAACRRRQPGARGEAVESDRLALSKDRQRRPAGAVLAAARSRIIVSEGALRLRPG